MRPPSLRAQLLCESFVRRRKGLELFSLSALTSLERWRKFEEEGAALVRGAPRQPARRARAIRTVAAGSKVAGGLALTFRACTSPADQTTKLRLRARLMGPPVAHCEDDSVACLGVDLRHGVLVVQAELHRRRARQIRLREMCVVSCAVRPGGAGAHTLWDPLTTALCISCF